MAQNCQWHCGDKCLGTIDFQGTLLPPVALADYMKKKIVPSVRIIPVNILCLENQFTFPEQVSENWETDPAKHFPHEWPLQLPYFRFIALPGVFSSCEIHPRGWAQPGQGRRAVSSVGMLCWQTLAQLQAAGSLPQAHCTGTLGLSCWQDPASSPHHWETTNIRELFGTGWWGWHWLVGVALVGGGGTGALLI